MLRHQLAFISFLLILWLFPAFLHAQGKFTGGSVTVDAGGAGDFTSLHEAAENYNTYGITGHTTLVISSDLEETQTAQFGNAPGSGTYKLTITSDDTRRTVSGDIDGPVIRLLGANNITIDGIAQATASDLTGNLLVVQNTHTVESASVGTIHVIADGTDKGSNIVIRNTEMGNAVGNTQGIANLLVSTDSIRVEGCYLHGANESLIAQNLRRLVFKNNVVINSRKSGLSITMYYPEQCVISGNMIDNITGSGNGNLQLQGIFLSSAGLGTLTIADNTIRNISNQMTGDAGAYGMVLSSDGYLNVSGNKISAIGNASDNPAHSAAGIFCILGELGANGGVADLKNNIIENITDRNFPFGIEIFSDKATARGYAVGNTITGISASASVNGNNAAGIAMNAPGIVSGNRISGIVAPAGSAKGLYGQHELGDITLMYNNFLWDITGKSAAGIYIEKGTGFKAYHNTVFLSDKSSAGDEAVCVVLSTDATDAELRNNLLVNTAPGNASNNQAVVLQSASPVLSENRYHIANGGVGKTASNTGYGNINAWNAATGDNSVRLQNAPAFVSAEDLHLSGTSTTDPLLHTALLADVPKDIDGTFRSPCSNAAGADNFSANPAFSFGNFSARTACLTMPSYINFEVTGGVAPFSYKVDGGAQTNIAADSVTLSGNRAFSFNRVLSNGNHTIQVTDAGSCTFTTSQTLAINATGTSIWYVNQAVAVSGDGVTPATAFKDLQEALDNGCLKTDDTIKIAKGTYLPSKIVSGTGVRDKVFYITKSIHLKGAYNPGFTERDTVAYKTLLSGDIGIQDDKTDNAYHVIIWNSSDAVNGSIDGFVICDGNANGGASTVVARGNGGGLFHNKGGLKIVNTTVRNNETSGNGGGIFSTAALTIEGSTIYSNISGQSGAGVYSNTTLILVMKNVTISGNKAGYTGTIYNGGGIYVNNSLTLQGQIIVKDNTVNGGGGGIWKTTGGIFDVTGLTSLTITGNLAKNSTGGGIYSGLALDLSNLQSGNISNNKAYGNGGGIYANVDLTLRNMVVSGNIAGYNFTTNQISVASSGGGIYANASLKLNETVTVENNTAGANGGGIWKMTSGAFDATALKSLTVIGNTALNGTGGGIHTAAILDLSGVSIGNILNNAASGNGGGIYANLALSLGNSIISGNKAGYKAGVYSGASHGGGFFANNALTLTGNMIFENDTASGSGGAIYKSATGAFGVAGLGKLLVNNNASNLASTSATSYNGGGGIWTGISMNLSSVPAVEFKNNSSKGKGGAVCAGGTLVDLTFGSAVFSNNKSGYDFLTKAYTTTIFDNGGGIYAANALTLSGNMVFENDTASGSGGAIYKNGTTAFDVSKLDELTVKGSTALNGTGGGIHTMAILDLSGVSIGNILNNAASGNGGGIYANLALSLGNTIVSGNKAGYKTGVYSGASHGGGVYASNSLTLSGNMVFESDTASGNGGAIYKSSTANTFFDVSKLNQLTVNNNAANGNVTTGTIGGGGIWTGMSLDLSRVLAAEFKNNSARGKGGAVCAGAAAVELAFNNAVFSNNKSGYDFLTKTYTTTGDDHGGAVYAANILTLKGNSTFKNNESGASGAVYANNALMLQGKVIFENNTSAVSGGGIWKGATGNIDVTGLNELTVTGNKARGGDGGGISTLALSLELSGVNKVTISDNKASGHGGGIYMGKTANTAFARLSLQNTTISNNKAGWNFATNDYGTDPYNGGGVYVNLAALMLSGNITFENNGASGNGGAIWKKAIFKSSIGYDDGPFDVTGLNVLNMRGNKAGISGGGIYTEAPLDFNNLKSGNISNNIAGQDGGAIFGIGTNLSGKYVGADMNMVNIHFSANTAGQYGGSIYAGDILETSQSIFTGNSAMSGGALYKVATGSMTVQKSTFTGNRADNGGAITSMLAAQTIFNSTFSGNTAASNGGAVCFATASAASNVITYCTFNNNRTDDNVANAIYYTNPNGSLKGNIIYGNGAGTEINNDITGLTTQYNIVRNPGFAGTGDQNLAAGNGANIFASSVGDIAAPADNGGTTPTILIKTNGLAHNQIVFDVAATFGPLGATDQRGENRVTGFTDIGSVELAPQPCSGTPEPVVWYVDAAAASGGDGTSIPDRAKDLNIVLTNACLKDGDTIKVAQGTYYSTNTGADKSFIVLKGITILGGYTSGFTETARNIVTQPTILDGKSLSYHVVIWNTGSNIMGNIDGVTIRNGKAIGTTPFIFAQDNGGGILLNNGILTVSNSTVADNTAINKGGGIHVSANTSLTLKNVTSRNNRAGHNGSAFTTTATGTSAVQLETRSGGGISALGKLELQGNMVFEYDMAGGNGGGIFLGLQCVFVADKLDKLTMTGCESKINVNTGDYGGGGIFTTLGVDLSNVKRAKFTDCIAMVQGGGIFINDKTGKLSVLKVANAGFTGCKALKDAGSSDASDGGAIESYYGTQSIIVVRNSTFKDCYAARYGGALGIGNALRLEGSVKIDNCTSDSNGGGITQWGLTGLPTMFDVSALDTLVITNCKSYLGGGIWINGTSLDFSNTKYVKMTGNFSKTHGGAIYMSNGATGTGVPPYSLTLRNTIISANRAGWDYVAGTYSGAYNGGGIGTTNSNNPIVLKGNFTLSDNTANGSGGAIYGATTITGIGLDTLKITGNTAMTAAGGGMYAGGAIDLSGLKYGEISGNVAKTNGGGIFANNALTLTRTSLYDNQADGNGGAIYKASSNLTLTRSTLAKNKAATGGGVYTTGGTNTISNCTFSENSATTNGGGLYAANTVKVTFSSFNGNTADGNGSGNAILFNDATNKTLNGNIIYGNGTGAEINVAPATASYNIVRGMLLAGTGNVNIIGANLGSTVFKTVTGDLATLEDNGGPTKTLMIAEQNQDGQAHNLIPVNTAKAFDATVTSDQRDSIRFAKCKSDCGSVEIQHDIATYAFKQPWARACPYTLIDADTLIAKTANIKDTVFYSDKSYTQLLAMPAKNVSRIYVKFTSLDGCVELRDTIKINLVPAPSVKVIGGKTRTVCSDGFIDLNINTANAANMVWSGWERSGTATGANTETLHFTPFQRTSDTTFYVKATAHSNSECILTASDSVLLTLKGLPTAVIKGVSVVDTLCAGQSFSFKVKTTNSGYLEWIGGSGNIQPVRLSTSLAYAADSITFTYTPAATERGQLVNLRLKSGSGVGACGYIEKDIKLFVMPQPIPAVFKLVDQPKGLQTICVDTLYEVKIKSPKIGRMKDIRIGLFDENITNITVNSAEYKYPYTGATWQSLGNYALNNRHYRYTLPMPLQPDDSVLVRIHVRAGCDFTSGDIVKFTLDATDECSVAFPQQTITSDRYTLRGDPSVANRYTFKTTYTPLTVNSHTKDTVLVRMNIVIEGTQTTDALREKIVTFIPSGLNIDPLSLKTIRNSGAVASSAVSGGTEYYMSIPTGIQPKDSVMYEFKISASDALCGTYTLRNQVYYGYEATCNAQTCPVSEIRASETADIEVGRYTFTLHSIQGETRLGKWSGDIQMNAVNGFFAGDSLKVDFYVDRNSDNRYQLADDGAAVATRYVKTPVKNVDIPTGGILPVQFLGIPVEPGLQLIAHSTDPLLCAPMQFPITIITGPDTTCQDKITTITLASGMKDYHVDVISGATIVLNTTLENLPNENIRKIKWLTASGDVPVKGGYTRTIQGQDIPSEKTAFVTHVNLPVTAGGLKTKENATEYCSPAKAKIYVENLKNASSMQWTVSTKAGTLSGINTDTLTYSFHNRANDTTLWVRFDAKALSDCEDYKDSIRLTIRASFDAGEISSVGQTFCAGQALPNPIGSLAAATGGDKDGGYTYRWLLNGTGIENTNTAMYTPSVVLPGVYIYTREAKDTRCNTNFTASTGTWTLTINALPTPTITGVATVCAGQSLTLTAEAFFASYVWTVTPAGNVTLNGGGTGNEETFTWSGVVGTKIVSVTTTDINGCEGTAIANIEVMPKVDTGLIYRVPNRE